MTALDPHPTILERRAAASRKAARTCAVLRPAKLTCRCGAERRPRHSDCKACHAAEMRRHRAEPQKSHVGFRVEHIIAGLLGAAS